MDNNYILVLTVQECGEEKYSLVMASLNVNKFIEKLNYYITNKEKFFIDVWDKIDYGYYKMKLYAFPINNDDPRHIDFEESEKFAEEIKAEILC